jgi:putative drug exporter of the RND superfamily
MRHPRAVLAVAAVVLVVLGIVGTGVESRLNPASLNVPGTEAEQANELRQEHFGESAPFAVLLQGPRAAIERQGPALVRALRRNPEVTTLSPWDQGSVARLRPSPRQALILVDFHVGLKTAVNETVDQLDETLERQIHSPVRATQSGFATISRAIQDESISATERGELIALPFLLIILLLVFRSPVAAAIPLALGAITVIAARGLLYFVAAWFSIDAFALVVCSMMGLALGVDYSLLMVSRFREELATGVSPLDAARETRRTAGRTTAFAGSTLLFSMLAALFILPGSLLASLAGTVALVVLLTVAVATIVGPALLILIGPNVDRWRIGRPAGGESRLMGLVGAALKRPAAVAALIGAVLLFLAAPALGLKTGPPSPEQLAKGNSARQDAELINRAIGPGFNAPFQMVVVKPEGPITDPGSLETLNRFQKKIASIPGVQFVVGPGRLAKRIEPLRDLGNAALASEGNIGPVKQLGRLGGSLAVAARGIGQLRSGITEASDGAGLLSQGADRAGRGAELIGAGLDRGAGGVQRAIGALDRFAAGTKRLEKALATAEIGALQIKLGLVQTIIPTLRANGLRRSRQLEKALGEEANVKVPGLIGPAQAAQEQLKQAYAQLQGMTVGKSDPNYAATLEAVRLALAAVGGTDPASGAPYAPGYAGLPNELVALQQRLADDQHEAREVSNFISSSLEALTRIGNAADQLTEGLRKLHAAGGKLADGSAQLAKAARRIDDGLARLGTATAALAGGIGRLGNGAEALQTALAEGAERTVAGQDRLRRASIRVIDGKRRINARVDRVQRATPGIFNSGYFVLSALDGAPRKIRENAEGSVDLQQGGQAAMMLVISEYSFNTPGSIALNETLNERASDLAEESGYAAGVAGGAAQLNDYNHVTRDRIPYVVIAITIVTFLLLLVILRALPLAAIAVGLNLLTVGVAFGILTLLFHVPDDFPLGGHNYVEAVGATAIFGLVFGLSIDYAVFLLIRMREHYDRHGDNAAAVHFGLEKTAGVITGAAAIMTAVFVAFAGAPFATVSQLGVGLTVAVVLDATVVRIVLLPALMLLLGDRVWWLPAPLKRALPKFSV